MDSWVDVPSDKSISLLFWFQDSYWTILNCQQFTLHNVQKHCTGESLAIYYYMVSASFSCLFMGPKGLTVILLGHDFCVSKHLLLLKIKAFV